MSYQFPTDKKTPHREERHLSHVIRTGYKTFVSFWPDFVMYCSDASLTLEESSTPVSPFKMDSSHCAKSSLTLNQWK